MYVSPYTHTHTHFLAVIWIEAIDTARYNPEEMTTHPYLNKEFPLS